MSALAAVARPATERWSRGERELSLRLLSFTTLAVFASLHYAALVSGTPTVRVIAVVAVAAVFGAALSATGRLHARPVALAALRSVLCALAAGVALLAVGVPAQLLEPAHWNAFFDDVLQGLGGLNGFQWPYAGGDPWIRLAVLLAIPALSLPAAALAFWPATRLRAVRGGVALAMLIALYAIGVAERPPGASLMRGLALLGLVAAWLWLPRLGRSDALAAGGWLVAIAAAAAGLTLALQPSHAWLDYHSWNLFSGAGGGTQFEWDQLYGPISWPRSGAELLDVRSAAPHYWKAETLDRFDGVRWIHSDEAVPAVARDGMPRLPDERWLERVAVSVRALHSNLVVAPGTLLNVDSSKLTVAAPDGTTQVVDAPLRRGDTYTASSYVPQPSVQQLRRAPSSFPSELLPYTYFDLPARGQSGLDAPDLTPRARHTLVTSRTAESTVPGLAGGDSPALKQRILASPYGQAYVLARSLAAGQPTTYDVVNAVQSYLERGYSYSERPPSRRYPLAAFLFQDRTGYCQQFSGAMALMLRMDGIPARIATGFAPGTYDAATRQYVVRDYDAHAWVEVYFSGIGWVTFDPTPPIAPAVGRSAPTRAASIAPSLSRGAAAPARRPDPLPKAAPQGPAPARRAGGAGPLAIVLVLAAALLAALAAIAISRRRRYLLHPDGAADELRRALERLGHSCPAGTTLTALERRLGRSAGPASARYARMLRDRRFAPPRRARSPSASLRRALRCELARGRGPTARVRVLLALPPVGRLPAINLPRVQSEDG